MIEERVVVSFSELSTFRQCPLLHEFKYRQRWVKPVEEGSALDKGKQWHAVMEIHYKTIFAWNRAHPDVSRRTDAQERGLIRSCRKAVAHLLADPITGEQTDVQALIEWMYNGYVELYGADRDHFRPLAIEHPIEVPLLDEHRNPTRFILKARIDLIGVDLTNGLRGVVDHKSAANLPDDMSLEIDDQFGLYCWMLKQAGKRASNAFHFCSRTQRNQADFPDYTGRSKPQALEQRFRRTPLTREPIELDNLALDAYYAARAAYPDDEAYAARYSAPDPRTCGWKCDIKREHLLMRKGRQPHQVMLEGGWHVDRTRH